MIEMLKAKIHRAVVTDANLQYEGSISIASELMDAAGIYEYQKVLISDINNGSRFETYVIRSQEKGCICLNGSAARLVSHGDRIIIMSYVLVDEKEAKDWKPTIVLVDEQNNIVKKH